MRRARATAANPPSRGSSASVPPTTSASSAPRATRARKLLPALYNLAHEGALPERFN
jgi:hypothetical protein